MKRVAFANILDEKNLGDMHCNPGRLTYVQEELAKVGWEVVVCDFRAIPLSCHAIVFGGGGMLHPNVDLQLEAWAKQMPTACWGIGINYHEEHGPEMRQWKRALLAMSGPRHIRDFDQGRLNTPCPSCLDPRLNVALAKAMLIPYEFKARPLIIEHKQFPIQCPYEDSVPSRRIKNDCSTSFEEALKLIGNSRFVVTNTFHGAYWSLLLGVQAYIPSDQLFSTRHQTAIRLGARSFDRWADLAGIPGKLPLLRQHQHDSLLYLDKIKKWLASL